MKAMTVLDKLHKRGRRVREKGIAEYAREPSKGAKPAVASPHEAKSGLVPNGGGIRGRRPTRVMRRNWRPRVGRVFGVWMLRMCKQRTDRGNPQTARTRLLTIWLRRSGSFKATTGIGVDAIHPSMWSRISEKRKQLYTDLLKDVERALTWLAQIQTLIYLLDPKTPIGERPIGLMPSLDQWMLSQTRPCDWACKGRSAEMAARQHLVLEEGQDDKPGMGRATVHDEVH